MNDLLVKQFQFWFLVPLAERTQLDSLCPEGWDRSHKKVRGGEAPLIAHRPRLYLGDRGPCPAFNSGTDAKAPPTGPRPRLYFRDFSAQAPPLSRGERRPGPARRVQAPPPSRDRRPGPAPSLPHSPPIPPRPPLPASAPPVPPSRGHLRFLFSVKATQA